jgi:hypothetical protein
MNLSALRRDAVRTHNCQSQRTGLVAELPNPQLGGLPCEGSIRP